MKKIFIVSLFASMALIYSREIIVLAQNGSGNGNCSDLQQKITKEKESVKEDQSDDDKRITCEKLEKLNKQQNDLKKDVEDVERKLKETQTELDKLKVKKVGTTAAYERLVIGFEQGGASAAKSEQNYFINVHVNSPFPMVKINENDIYGPRLRTSGDFRITSFSQPQLGEKSVKEFVQGGLQENFSNLKLNKVAKAIEFLGGLEYRLTGWPGLKGAKYANETHFSLSMTVSGGGTTPFNPEDTVEIFKLSDELKTRLTQQTISDEKYTDTEFAGKDYVGFVNQDRDRFFRQLYTGFRFKTFYNNKDNDELRPPSEFDLAYGFNEAVTGGRMRLGVLRADFFYPLPWEKTRSFYIYGTIIMNPKRNNITDPLIAERANVNAQTGLPLGPNDPGYIKPTGNNVLLVPVPQINRDYYRIGAGIDIIELIKSLTPKKSASDNQ